MPFSEEHTPILTITTSKNWVLPPRPKNSRKNRANADKKKSRPAPDTAAIKTESSIKMSSPVVHVSSPLSQPLKMPVAPVSLTSSTKKPLLHTKQSPAPPSKPLAYHEKPPLIDSPCSGSVHELKSQIEQTDRENYNLKSKLLSLIHDYRCLKAQVDSASSSSFNADLYDTATTARKRVFNETGDGIMSDLISDLNHLSHTSTLSPLEQETDIEQSDAELFNFVNLDLNNSQPLAVLESQETQETSVTKLHRDETKDIIDEFVYSERIKSPCPNAVASQSNKEAKPLDEIDEDVDDDFVFLSRSTSPLVSETDENSLMTSLTRSTTVSTNNSFLDKKSYPKFFELPVFSEDDDGFSFENPKQDEKTMSVIEEDHYNQVADFLEEKLMSNDVKYYVREI